MTHGFPIPAQTSARTAILPDPVRLFELRSEPFLTVPLLRSARRGRLQLEGLHQVDGRLAQRQVVQRRPEIDDVALRPVLLGEAVEDVGVELDAEGAASAVAAVDRTGAAPLRTVAAR